MCGVNRLTDRGPEKIEFREFTVTYDPHKKRYKVSIAPNFRYLFKSTAQSTGKYPGWLAALSWENWEDAVEYGKSLLPIIHQAHVAHGYWNEAQRTLINTIYSVVGEHDYGRL